jgi:hypothetical protein
LYTLEAFVSVLLAGYKHMSVSSAASADMSTALRELLPAPEHRADSPRTSEGEERNGAHDKRKGKLIKIACRVCQKRRVKVHPIPDMMSSLYV